MKRLALMMGIDEYLIPQWRLKGCVNDHNLLRELLLTRFGFEEANIASLTNTQATREAILDAMDRLAGMGKYEGQSIVAEGDLVVITYSGHGSRLKEPEDQRDEADGYDSTLVPCDSDRPKPAGLGGPNKDITDDEIFARVQRIKERAGHLVMHFDCCHSGTISRDTEGGLARTMPDDERHGDVERLSGFSAEGARGETTRGGGGFLPLDEGYIFMAGAADTELAREYRDLETKESYGALTYHLVQEMQKGGGKLTYRDVFQPARSRVTTLYPSQHPQMEGDWNRKLFELDEVPVQAFVAVRQRLDDHRVLLAAGATHGATVGSEWRIVPGSLGEAQTLATVTLRSVGPLVSEAASDTPLPPEVVEGCRAIETVHALGEFRVPVAVEGVDSGELNKLREMIRGSQVLTLAKEGPVDMLAVLLPPRTEAELQASLANTTDGATPFAPELGPISVPTWVVVGRDRAMLPLPPHTTEEADAAEITFSNLETWARYRNVQQLRPVGADPLRGKLKVKVKRRTLTGTLEEFPIHEATRLPLIREGETVRIHLENDLNRPLYFTMLGLDATGGISHLYPPAHAEEPLGPYGTLPLQDTYYLPATFPAALPGGRESLKFLVTLKYVDYTILEQEGARSDGQEVADWFAGATRGGSAGSIRPLTDTLDEDTWTVEQFDYFMVR